MSPAELTSLSPGSAPAVRGRTETISGFGRTRRVTATVVRVRDAEHVSELLAGAVAPRGLIARGAGLSYGDPAQNEGGLVLDTTSLAEIHAIDERSGDVTVGAGALVADVLRALARHGLTLPVVPGTSALTVGGAIAADVHGKNHPHRGSFGAHVRSLSLVTPADGPLEIGPGDLLDATLGGMGLTGVITAATLATSVLRSPCAVADVDRAGSIEEAIGLILSSTERHTHAIAWLDLLAGGDRFTRAVVTRSREGEQAAGPCELSIPPPRFGFAPPLLSGVLPAAARAFNPVHWLRSPRRARELSLGVGPALFPLDAVAGWNRAYGSAGLVQYQAAVPRGAEGQLRALLELLRAATVCRCTSPPSSGSGRAAGACSRSRSRGGRSPSTSRPVPSGLADALRRADALVAEAGGRVYLAKDSRLAPDTLGAMYPRLARFGEVRARVDPHELLRSDMSRRLGLTR